MQAIDLLLNRVSVARLCEPAPSAEQRELLFRAALRVPDHGQLQPWRFLTVEGQGRERLGQLFVEALERREPAATPEALQKAARMPMRAPLLIIVVARLRDHPKVPHSEQLLAAGCAAHAMLLAAHAQGIGAVWRTGDFSYDAHVAAGLGLGQGEQIIGFLYMGTPEGRVRAAPEPATGPFVQRWGD
ncbi:NAD(P)H nitroreductase [Stutzerimonas azotifigens]|uniref:Putative NAD(P)H nitroreductase n=1 Tax=Stutzerimonas azotifigens TaxID=291995 RepID=A0ABR5Z329_9GAMM|nr:NAD(P)H nitroreductase [Stutzerimonas azotifigens]MBA1274640.1 NAD(P)H nitroreductase [Stutzerimonas azotifigens]